LEIVLKRREIRTSAVENMWNRVGRLVSISAWEKINRKKRENKQKEERK